MMRAASFFVAILLIASPGLAQKVESIRRGWKISNGPYNGCSWLVVSGPEAARQQILDQAKKTYSQPDPARLAGVEGKIFVEILTWQRPKMIAGVGAVTDLCPDRAMKEVIFVDQASDSPALRLPLESRDVAISYGFGANWNANAGIGVANLADFRAALGRGRYDVVVAYEDGGINRIGHGTGQAVWSGTETSRIDASGPAAPEYPLELVLKGVIAITNLQSGSSQSATSRTDQQAGFMGGLAVSGPPTEPLGVQAELLINERTPVSARPSVPLPTASRLSSSPSSCERESRIRIRNGSVCCWDRRSRSISAGARA